MSTLLEPDSGLDRQAQQAAAQRVRHQFTACRLRFRWLGTSKSLNTEQKIQAAETFGADTQSIRAGKKLIDTSHEGFKALTSLRTRTVKIWRDRSLPYPEPGIRLIRQDRIEELDYLFTDLRRQLQFAVEQLDESFEELKQGARQRLGSLFDPDDYPDSLLEEFGFEWDFPAIDPPDYLQSLSPELYRQQAQRVAERFEQTVELAEQAFMEELSQLVSHLAERLAGSEDGKPKVFRDSAVTGLADFFQRFRQLNINSNEQLDELVDRCEGLLSGVQPQRLRDSQGLRQLVATNLASVQSSLDQLLVERPRRNIQRRPR